MGKYCPCCGFDVQSVSLVKTIKPKDINDNWTKQWLVKGDSGSKCKVSNRGKEWACSCVGWTRHMPRKDCKHITFIKEQ